MPAEPAYVPDMGAATLLTADQLLHTHIPDKHVELVRGVLIVREPPGYLHGDVTARLALLLMKHVENHSLGRVLAAETGFHIAANPDTVRAPDIAFLSQARVPDPRPRGYLTLPPDLVVEVLSPNDRPGEVLGKLAEWLSAGTQLVWVIDPERRLARVYRHDGTERIVNADEALDGEDVVPGFSCLLERVL